ncbi:MAG: hypothetical protein ACI9R3_006112 [Verrucomicrobiales bacterium]|jgi:hypothetical protein
MNSLNRRTLTPGRITALSRQGQRWWPHSESPACVNTFRELSSPTSSRMSGVPGIIALPLAAASVATLISNHTQKEADGNGMTYAVHAPIQAEVTRPYMAPATTVIEPIADRGKHAANFSIPHAEPAASPPVQARDHSKAVGVPVSIAIAQSESESEPEPEPELKLEPQPFVDPFHSLDLAQEEEELGPETGLLPDLDDPITEAHPEIFSVKEIVDAPRGTHNLSKLARYQKEFPEIFGLSSSGSSSSDSTPFTPAALMPANRQLRQAVARARQWRDDDNRPVKNEGRPLTLLQTLGKWLKSRS